MLIMSLTYKTSFICIASPALLNNLGHWHSDISKSSRINVQHHHLIISGISKSFPDH